MSILLLGKNGQVGTELQRCLLPLGTVVALGRSELCLSDPRALEEQLSKIKPTIIVNAAAYTAVDKAESEPELAEAINASAVACLARYAAANQALLVHYSTDYVFDGSNDKPYREDDTTNPQNVYGVSKRAGELAIEQSGCNYLIFRTSWVFSAKGSNFIKTILRLAKQKSELSVVSDQFGAPTSAELIADITALAIAAYKRGALPNGIYHLTSNGVTNWHQLACYVVEKSQALGMTYQLEAAKIRPVTTEEYPLPAKRPKNSRLDNSMLANALQLTIPDWSVHVDRMLEQLRYLYEA